MSQEPRKAPKRSIKKKPEFAKKQRPHFSMNIPEELFEAAKDLSVKYRIPSPRTALGDKPSNVAGFIRAMLYALVRREKIRCDWVEEMPPKLAERLKREDFMTLKFERKYQATGVCRRQFPATQELYDAVFEMCDKLDINYGQLVRDLLEFAVKKM